MWCRVGYYRKMTSTFCFGDSCGDWKSNGFIRASVAEIADAAQAWLGDGHPISVALQRQLVGWFPGAIVQLDEFLTTQELRADFVILLDVVADAQWPSRHWVEEEQAKFGEMVPVIRRWLMVEAGDAQS